MIPEDHNGIVERKWGGGSLPPGRIIATGKESGIWAQMLSPGLKFWYWPWMYKIVMQPITVVKQGQIAYVESIDGAPMPQGNIISRTHVECGNYTDGVKFIQEGGVKGYQSAYLANGEYRINTQLFKVGVVDATKIPTNMIGVVTTHDGKPLPSGDIAGPEIDVNHNDFQDVNQFLEGGGFKGLQQNVLRAGTYHIHPKFATVEVKEMCRVHVGHVGVVNSFVGKEGGKANDASGDDFQHGNIVPKGHKGIWSITLDPGYHPINPEIMEILMVPTTNIVLKWANDAQGGSHSYDKGLNTINIRSKDGFDFTMEVDQVINISDVNAPKVIARFGTIQDMVDQVLEPTVGNYFRNSAQTSEALEFVFGRAERQEEARKHIEGRLTKYNIVCVDTLIGDINPPKALMDILSQQKEADQQKQMWVKKKESAEQEQSYVKAQTAAKKEAELTSADYNQKIAKADAAASVEQATGKRDSAKIEAEGEAYVLKTVGDAKGGNIKAVGGAEAEVIEKKTKAMGIQQFASVQIFEAIAKAGIPLVPQVLVQGGNGEGGGAGSLLEALIGNEMLKDLRKKAGEPSSPTATPPSGGGDASDDKASTEDPKKD